jgi:hypothetical protein
LRFFRPSAQYLPPIGTLPYMHSACRLALLSTLVLALVGSAAAQNRGSSAKRRDTSSAAEAFYRCRDASGQTHYGDSMPPACAGLDTEVLDNRGMLVRLIEGEATRNARLQREAVEAEQRKQREQREQRDRMLIETYLSVADIERLRDTRLDLLVAQYKVTEQNIANLRERQKRLEGQIARFKPYSDKPNAPPLPDHLAEDIVNTVNSLRTYEAMLTNNKREQAEIKANFASDIRRFKELRGLK